MKKTPVMIILVCMLIAVSVPIVSYIGWEENDKEVRTRTYINVPGTQATITDALSVANNGDTIVVELTHTDVGNVVVNREVTIVGQDKASCTVSPGGSGFCFDIQANNVVIKELKLLNAGSTGDSIQTNGYNNLEVRDCIIETSSLGGLNFQNSDTIRIANCTFSGVSGNNINLATCQNIIVENCNVDNSGSGDGLAFASVSGNATIRNSTFNGNDGDGISITGSSNNITVHNNTLAYNLNSGLNVQDCLDVLIYNNNFIDNMAVAHVTGVDSGVSWNASYPDGGNYWSGNPGNDNFQGVAQDQPGQDGMEDISYSNNISGIDNYAWLIPNGWLDVQNFDPAFNVTTLPPATDDVPYSYTPTYNDGNGDQVTWSMQTNAGFLAINPTTGQLTGTPTDAHVGPKWVDITIDDGNLGVVNYNFSLTVNDANDAPAINVSDNLTALTDVVYEHYYTAQDVDLPGDTLTWSMTTNSEGWLNFNPTTKRLYGTPHFEHVGTYWVDIMVSDGKGGEDHNNFTLEVLLNNFAPELTGENKTWVREPNQLIINFTGSDANAGDNLTYHILYHNCDWITFELIPIPRLIGSPNNSHVGECWINVTLMDEHGAYDFWNETITIANTPERPSIGGKVNATAYEGMLYEINFTAVDPDKFNTYTWELENKSSWLNLTQEGRLWGIPTQDQVNNEHLVGIYLRDNEGLSAFLEYSLTIRNKNDPPDWAVITSPASGKRFAIGEVITFKGNGTDPDTVLGNSYDNITFKWFFGDGNTAAGRNVTHSYDELGTYTVTFQVKDYYGLILNTTVSVVVDGEGGDEEMEVREEKKTMTSGASVSVTGKATGNFTIKEMTPTEVETEIGEENLKGTIGLFMDINMEEEEDTMEWANIEVAVEPDENDTVDDLSNLRLFWWDEDEGSWEIAENTGVNVDTGVVFANVSHFTIFAPMAQNAQEEEDPEEEGGDLVKLIGIIAVVAIVVIFIIVIIAVVIKKKKGEPASDEAAPEGAAPPPDGEPPAPPEGEAPPPPEGEAPPPPPEEGDGPPPPPDADGDVEAPASEEAPDVEPPQEQEVPDSPEAPAPEETPDVEEPAVEETPESPETPDTEAPAVESVDEATAENRPKPPPPPED